MPNDNNGGGTLSGALESKTTRNADPSGVERGQLEGDEVKFNARIPEPLRDAFQDVCKKEGRSMSWVVREFMRRAVREGETGL